jgi:hypothetical protein
MFVNDLAWGKRYEQIAMDMIGGNAIVCPNGAFSDWDFKVDDEAYEVKSDRRAYKTGNLCIEYEHTNIPSGISISKATYYIYFVIRQDNTYDCYKIPVTEIKRIINTFNPRKASCDNGNSHFYLVPTSYFNSYKIGAQMS